MKIRNKLLLPISTILILGVLIILFTDIYNLKVKNNISIEKYKQMRIEKSKNELKQFIDIPVSFAENRLQNVQNVDEKEALKTLLLQDISVMRFGESGYFWITDDQLPYPKMIMHATSSKLNGTILDNPKFDVAMNKKQNLFQAMVEVCNKSGDGFVNYVWNKPGEKIAQPKLSYVKKISGTNWIIGTGFYIDYIDKEILNRKKNNEIEINKRILNTIIFSVISLLILISLINFLTAMLVSKPLYKLSLMMQEMSEGNLTVEQELANNYEIGMIGIAYQEIQVKISALIKKLADNSSTIANSNNELATTANQLATGSEDLSSQISTVLSASEEISVNSQTIASANTETMAAAAEQASTSSEQMSANTETMATAAEQASTNLNNVITAVSGMTENIENIATNSEDAAYELSTNFFQRNR